MARLPNPSFLFLTILCLAVSVTGRPSTQNIRAASTELASPPIRIHHPRGEKGTGQNVMRAFPVADTHSNDEGGAGSTTANAPLKYHGGPVMTSGVNVYLIWYGNWDQPTANASSVQILRNFIASLGPNNTLTPGANSVRGWYNILLSYYQIDQTGNAAYVSPNIGLAGEYADTYSQGSQTTLDGDAVPIIVKNALNYLPTDENGIYFVLPSPDVHVKDFCHKWCGYHQHTNLTYSGVNTVLKYALVPNPVGNERCCGVGNGGSPNGDIGMDAMITVFAHEMAETISDPESGSWWASHGNENGDKCAYNYGPTALTSSGAKYNLVGAGMQPFLAQQMWDITTQQCAQQGPSPPQTAPPPNK